MCNPVHSSLMFIETRNQSKSKGIKRKHRIMLPIDFSPKATDILCGRGNVFSNHEGNQYFANLIRTNMRAYVDASNRAEKIRVVDSILREIQRSGFRFAKIDHESKRWYQLDDVQAHQKIGHAIRDTIRLLTKDQSKNPVPKNQAHTKTIQTTKPLTAAKRKMSQQRRKSQDNTIEFRSSPTPRATLDQKLSNVSIELLEEAFSRGFKTIDILDFFLGDDHSLSQRLQQGQCAQSMTVPPTPANTPTDSPTYSPTYSYSYSPTPTPTHTHTPAATPSYCTTGIAKQKSPYLLENEYPDTGYDFSAASFFGDSFDGLI